MSGRVLGLNHVQLAMPYGREDDARAFYVGVLGLREEPKPETLSGRGGVWFTGGTARVHLGVEGNFQAAKKAHPALLVDGLAALAKRCTEAGFEVVADDALPGHDRAYVSDPFGMFGRPKDWIDIEEMALVVADLDSTEVLRWTKQIAGDDDDPSVTRLTALL